MSWSRFKLFMKKTRCFNVANMRLMYTYSEYHMYCMLYAQDNPPSLRSKPLVVTTIAWSRHLSNKIEIPMKTFRETKFIMQSKVCVCMCVCVYVYVCVCVRVLIFVYMHVYCVLTCMNVCLWRQQLITLFQQESQYCIKLYNKLTLALATFENLYMNQWKSSINAATKALQSTLLKVTCTLTH